MESNNLALLYECDKQWKSAKNSYKQSLEFFMEAIKIHEKEFGKFGKYSNQFHIPFQLVGPYIKLKKDKKARDVIQDIIESYKPEIESYQKGDRDSIIPQMGYVAKCYFFLNDFERSYEYSKSLLEWYENQNIITKSLESKYINLLSKAKIENQSSFANDCKKQYYEDHFIKDSYFEIYQHNRRILDLYPISDLLSNNISADIKEVLRIGGWSLDVQ